MDLSNLRRKHDFLQNDAPDWCRVIWPRPEAFNHFIKSNRGALIAAGVATLIGREWFIDVEKFPDVAAGLLKIKTP